MIGAKTKTTGARRFSRFRRWRDRFYAGPPDLGIRPFRHKGYQSPTLTALLWGYALAVRHLSLAGRIVFICAGVIFPYGMLSLSMPVHLLAFAIGGIFAVDCLLGLALSSRFWVECRMPARIVAGGTAPVEYRVVNRGRTFGFDVAVDTLPFPRGLHLAGGRASVGALGPGEAFRSSAQIRARRRGEYILPAVRASSGFPFYLWQWGTTCGAPRRLLVYPRFTPLVRLDLPVGRRYQPGGISLSSNVGESMEFLGCRDFRDGDDPRRIHWRSWARVGSPVVKEFREEYLRRAAVVLDTAVPRLLGALVPPLPGEAELFEAAVSITAAAADYLARREFVVDLFAAGPEIYRFQGGRSLAYLEHMLDILACLKPHPSEPFKDLVPVLVEEIRRFSGAILFLVSWNDLRRELLARLAAAGVLAKAFLVARPGRVPADLPEEVIVLRDADIAAGRVQTL